MHKHVHIRCSLWFLLLTLTLSALNATIIDDISFSFANDWHSPNIGYNYDDGLTFSGHVRAQFLTNFELRVDLASLTDRKTTKVRSDLLHISGLYHFTFSTSSVEYRLTPHLSFLAGGDLGLQDIQNSWHTFRGIPIVDIAQVNEQSLFALAGGGELSAYLPIFSGSLEAQVGFTLSNHWTNTLHATLAYYPDNATRLALSYRHLFVPESAQAYNVFLERYQGFEISFVHEGGPIGEAFYLYPREGISFGAYTVNVLRITEPPTFQHSDWTYSFGFAFDQDPGTLQYIGLTIKNVGFEIRNVSGSIKDSHELEIARHQGGLFALSYRFDFPLQPWLTPYLKPFIALHRFAYLDDLKPIYETYLPSFGMEAGVRFADSTQLVFGGTAYHPKVGVSVHYIANSASFANQVPATYPHPHRALQVAVLIGLDIEHDLTALRNQAKRPDRGLPTTLL